MQSLTLRLMGPVELTGPGNLRLTPRGMRARGALAVMGSAVAMRVLRARLQDLLFSTRDPDHANASLRQVLREVIPEFIPAELAAVPDAGAVVVPFPAREARSTR